MQAPPHDQIISQRPLHKAIVLGVRLQPMNLGKHRNSVHSHGSNLIFTKRIFQILLAKLLQEQVLRLCLCCQTPFETRDSASPAAGGGGTCVE